MIKIAFGLVFSFMFSVSPAFAYRSISTCISTTTIGSASVTEPGFSYRMRALRAQCLAAEDRYEAAAVVWSQYDRAYECQVGWHCSQN